MEFYYGNLALHDVGELSISQGREYEGGENPYRARVTLRVVLNVFEDTFVANRQLLERTIEAVRSQHQVLRWADAETGNEWVNQTAVVTSHNLPDDPNGWGTWEGQVEIVFAYYEQNLETNFIPFTIAAGGVDLQMGLVLGWKEELASDYFDTAHDARRLPALRRSVRGVFLANAAAELADRQAELQGKAKLWRESLLGVAGGKAQYTFGIESGEAKVESLRADPDQPANQILWELVMLEPLVGDPETWVFADYTITLKDGDLITSHGALTGTGEQFLTVTGKVTAKKVSVAVPRIDIIRQGAANGFGFQAGELLRSEIGQGIASTLRDGTQFLEATFTLEWRRFRGDNLDLVFTKTGGNAALSLGNVLKFSHAYNARRFSELRSQRVQAGGAVTARGVILAPQNSPLASRRDTLKAKLTALEAAMDGADGRMVYGIVFNKVVRVESFVAEIDQAITRIEWSLSASYSQFPNEAGYATVELQVAQRENVEDGDQYLSLTGTIWSQTEAAALVKLNAVRTTVLAQYGFTAAKQLRKENNTSSVFANGDKTAGLVEAADGTTFTQLTFAEEYRKRMASVDFSTLRTSDSEETSAGTIISTYSGSVMASGASLAAAYAAALGRAQALGADKHPFLLRSEVNWEQRKTRADNDAEFVRLEFSYSYQRKGGARVFIELSTEFRRNTFGTDAEQVQGSIAAVDYATAKAAYEAQVKGLYASMLILDESFTEQKQRLGAAGGGSYTDHFARFAFALTVFTDKTGTTSFRYEIESSENLLTLDRNIRISGTCWATSAAVATAAIDALVGTLVPGTARLTERMNGEPRQKSGTLEPFMEVRFARSYADRLTGQTGLLECEVSEEVQYSGPRLVAQPIPRNAAGTGGVSIVQDCGVQEGYRSVRGSALCATESAGRTWANTQRGLLTGDNDGGRYEQPQKMDTGWMFVPRTDGVPRGTGLNARVVKVGFSFGEILPNYPYTVPSGGGAFSAASAPAFSQSWVFNETTGKWHKWRARNNDDGRLEYYLDPMGVS